MLKQSEAPISSKISEQTFLDLCMWLSDDITYSQSQLDRLLNEDHYLSLIELANTYWLIGHLNKQLKKHNIWVLLPRELVAYLTELDRLYLNRSLAIKQEIIAVSSMLKEVTPKIVLLKGAATLFNGLANPISTRYMTDIDILVSEETLGNCLSKIKCNGYILDKDELSIETNDFHHAPPAIREDGPCYIELHRRPLVNSLTNILDKVEAIETSVPLELAKGLVVQQMHPTQQIIHTIAHSELQDRGYAERHIDLRQLLNFYLVTQTFGQEICWKTVEERYKSTSHLHILNSVLYQANKLFGLTVPSLKIDKISAQKQLQHCLQSYSQSEPEYSKRILIQRVLKGYSRNIIINIYGEKGHFPIFRGRLKHFRRHTRMLLKGKVDTLK
jgi:hypothetical protein